METKRIVFVGVGGQGNILASRLVGEACVAAGIPAVVSEIHGMAQRGGIVETDVVIGDATSPIVSSGEADGLIGFEPSETLRALNKCNENTVVITNVQPLPPFTVAIGQGSYPDIDEALDLIRARVRSLISLDGNELAEKAGNPLSLNMVMLGALVGSKVIPLDEGALKETIAKSTKQAFLESNLKAFDFGVSASRVG
ncbi:MAG: indolepyruvate oxidoreductase subunit beta [Deltaproteobacteria bacterium]|nr:indolepyruvate oxidoreductase subunit beta [Deltaproteobacteria bacterium]MBW2076167.1 indolepyruvate oxidoreductase subunit beta [Deltaproteobacteria bacterium]MBW2310391.1 indolepyruvate oxidoreductase subunit beta [Deltaproteobacteria bacterium]